MRRTRRWMAAGVIGVLAAGGCARGEHGRDDYEPDEPRVRGAAVPRREPAPASAADWAEVRARVDARGDSVRATFAQVRRLKWREVWGLRRDKNAEQIARAQSLGVRASGEAEIERLRKAGRLVALGDSTPYWVLRKMEHSVPYVTPDTRAMLVELGRRFHAQLDSLGLPRYRVKITSALRTDETQAELRKTNPNASQTVSSHEFGTTVDISHERFAAPADSLLGGRGAPEAAPEVLRMQSEVLDTVGKENARALQAALGRVLIEMRAQGALMVMMEDRQPVYHMTVARRFPRTE